MSGIRGWALGAAMATLAAGPVAAEPVLSEDQVVGRWVGTGRMAILLSANIQVEFKLDGTLQGGVSSRLGEMTYTTGRWRIEGDTLRVDYTAVSRRGTIDIGWALRQSGERLLGIGTVKPVHLHFHIDLGRAK